MANEKVVQTDVDKLLALIQEKKQLPMEEAATAIHLPQKTVESLATLLEEEGLLHITYKFTTPYLNFGPPKAAFGEKAKGEKKAGDDLFIFTQEGQAGLKRGDSGRMKGELRPAAGEIELPEKQLNVSGETGAAASLSDSPTGKAKRTLPDDLEKLVAMANEYLNKGDIETAREIFIEIKRRKTDLPGEYLDKERKLKDSLLHLNEALILGIDKALSTEFSRKQEEMAKLFNDANALMKNGAIDTAANLKKAEDLYTQLKQLYIALPEGFVERRVMLQTQLLMFYKTIISSKKRIFWQDFTVKSRQIVAMMQQVVARIDANDLSGASAMLQQVNVLYSAIPEGFLKEKTQLQHQILEIYQRLILSKENMYANEITIGAAKIDGLLNQAYAAAEKNDLGKAREIFTKATDAYASLPQGFLETKVELESRLLDLHNLLSLKLNKALLEETKRHANEINLMLQTAQGYILGKQYDLAREFYLEILTLYNTIPQGYPELIQVQTAVLNLYKQLMPHIIEIPSEQDVETKRKHDELLKLLVQIHEHIKRGEFDRIKPKYLMAYKIYHDLPLGFLDKRTELYREIYKVYHELRLYTDVNRLAEYANARDYDHLQQALTAINDAYNKSVSQYPEDMEIFRYIWQRYLIYLNLLKEHVQERGPTGREVRQRIETVAKTTSSPAAAAAAVPTLSTASSQQWAKTQASFPGPMSIETELTAATGRSAFIGQADPQPITLKAIMQKKLEGQQKR